MQKNNDRFPWLPIALLVGLSVLATIAYVKSEHALYWSDYWHHWYFWQESVDLFRVSPPIWIAWLLSSDAERSSYYTIANLPAGLLFGTSRLCFILSLVVCYAWPYMILTSVLVARIFKQPGRRVFWIALSVIGINPLFWAIPLRGYPDYAAACAVMFAWLMYLKDPLLKRSGDAAKLGMLFGLAPLLRRHYAYLVLSACASMFVHSVMLLRQGPWKEFLKSAEFRRIFVRYIFVVLYALGISVVLAFNYLNELIHFNYDLVFKAFHLSLSTCLKYYLSSFGIVILALSAAGWYLAVKQQLLLDHNARLFLTYGLITFIIWFGKVDFVGLHYTTLFMPVITIGVVGLLVKLCDQFKQSAVAKGSIAAIYLFLLVNCAQGLGVPIPALPNPTTWIVYLRETPGVPLGYLFSTRNAPVVRHDLPEITSLCKFISKEFGPKARLSVASSSPIFNDELFFDATNSLITGQDRANMPQFVKLPQIDFQDDSPIHNLAQCDCIIVAEPFQTHLAPGTQNILQFTVDSFRNKIGLAKDFSPVGPKFHLDDNVELTVYRRTSPPNLTELGESIDAFQPYDRSPHLMRNLWLVWKGYSDVDISFLSKMRKHVPIFDLKRAKATKNVELIYLGRADGPITFSGKVSGLASGRCQVAVSTVSAEAAAGQSPETLDKASDTFTVKMTPPRDGLLIIDIDLSGLGPDDDPVLQLPEPSKAL